MSRQLRVFLLLTLGWAWCIGALLYGLNVEVTGVVGLAVVALLYMPSPFLAAWLAEGKLRRHRFAIPAGNLRHVLPFLLWPTAAFLASVLLYLAFLYVGGNVLHLPGWGGLALTEQELVRSASRLVGTEAVAASGPLPPATLLLAVGLVGAVTSGWAINGFFALGEEYGWRGLMWEELRSKGALRANLIIGPVWGLWHAPLILQGYNYAPHRFSGVVAIIIFTTAVSLVLSALRERTHSVLPAAAAHGMINGFTVLFSVLAVDASPLLTGPIGVLGAAAFAVVGLFLWRCSPGKLSRDQSSSQHASTN